MLSSLLDDLPLPLLAVCVIAVIFTLRRTALRRRRKFDPIGDARAELQTRQAAQAEVARQELRLQEISRDAQAALQTKIAVLDQMVHEADREIIRLEGLLSELRRLPSPRLPDWSDPLERTESEARLTGGGGSASAGAAGPRRSQSGRIADSRQFLRLLHQAGFSAAEIARTSGLSELEVRDILGESDDRGSRAA